MIEKLYGKNINFLIGSGASFGVIPTLSSNYTNDKNEKLSIEEILEENKDDENLQNIIYLWYYHKILKIGSSGNITKKLSMKNYHKKIYHTGIFDNFDREIPIINLFKLHGSVSWKYVNDKNNKPYEIKVEYFEDENPEDIENLIEEVSNEEIKKAKEKIEEDKNLEENIKGIRNKLLKKFALIFPEKNKFENTLYQEFYYQNLRQLSYELEKQNSILIVFGFSFADEHIAEIVKRACNNPTLNIYIFCYSLNTKNEILNNLKLEEFPSNIKTILPEDNGNIDFKIFLKKLFEVNSKIESDNNE